MKRKHYNTKWEAIPVVFKAYNVVDYREGLDWLMFITDAMTRVVLSEAMILGTEPIPDDEE